MMMSILMPVDSSTLGGQVSDDLPVVEQRGDVVGSVKCASTIAPIKDHDKVAGCGNVERGCDRRSAVRLGGKRGPDYAFGALVQARRHTVRGLARQPAVRREDEVIGAPPRRRSHGAGVLLAEQGQR
jgi:hypothetical protein